MWQNRVVFLTVSLAVNNFLENDQYFNGDHEKLHTCDTYGADDVDDVFGALYNFVDVPTIVQVLKTKQ